VLVIARWLDGNGWHFLTLANVTIWGTPVAAATPWGSVPLLLPLVLVPMLPHLFGWVWHKPIRAAKR